MLDLFYVLFQIALLFPLLWVSNVVWKNFTPYNENIGLSDNKLSGTSIVYSGYMLAVAMFMVIAFYGESKGFFLDITYIFGLAILSNLLLIGGFKISSFLLTIQLKEKDSFIFNEIEKSNNAIAFYQFFVFVSMGILILISNYHRDLDLYTWLTITAPFFLIGIFIVFFLTILLQHFTSYNDVKELKDGNIAVAISFGGAIIAVSLLVANVLSQVQVFNLDSIMLLITYSIISFIFLLILPGLLTKYLVSKMVMNESTIDDFIKSGNLDIAILQAIVKVIFALVVVYAIPFNLF